MAGATEVMATLKSGQRIRLQINAAWVHAPNESGSTKTPVVIGAVSYARDHCVDYVQDQWGGYVAPRREFSISDCILGRSKELGGYPVVQIELDVPVLYNEEMAFLDISMNIPDDRSSWTFSGNTSPIDMHKDNLEMIVHQWNQTECRLPFNTATNGTYMSAFLTKSGGNTRNRISHSQCHDHRDFRNRVQADLCEMSFMGGQGWSAHILPPYDPITRNIEFSFVENGPVSDTWMDYQFLRIRVMHKGVDSHRTQKREEIGRKLLKASGVFFHVILACLIVREVYGLFKHKGWWSFMTPHFFGNQPYVNVLIDLHIAGLLGPPQYSIQKYVDVFHLLAPPLFSIQVYVDVFHQAVIFACIFVCVYVLHKAGLRVWMYLTKQVFAIALVIIYFFCFSSGIYAGDIYDR